MTVTIFDHELPDETHNLYDISFFSTSIHTLLTYHSSHVTSWLRDVTLSPTSNLIGFDVEWRPNFQRNQDNPIATVQLCTGTKCLIYHIVHADMIPQSILNFLNNTSYTFVGVGIAADVEKLLDDYGITVGKYVDLRPVAASVRGIRQLKNAGLKELTRVVLEKEISKPKSVTMSRWDNPWLTSSQGFRGFLVAFRIIRKAE
ncbi:3'-5' exonuclease domain-containing protein [Heracleum sosnowskyi]|uniref:3'-5' exonuclease domain-containing protein n=1 Tax=Heracleum sosnowskyi TaxID=360622 RepID=A0AAD8MVC2_9APIA|nr:3'-5' exonuclease domain-containing protein [Heracleum sosnowskyi]